MNPTNPQVSSSENYQLLLVSPCNSRDNDIFTISPPEQVTENFLPGQAESILPREDTYYVTNTEQPRSPYQQATVVTQNQIPPVHPNVFFYRPPKDFYHYHVNCEEIPYDTIESLLKKLFNDKENVTQFKDDEYIFCYQQKWNNRFYQVTCQIVSPLLVNNCLSKKFLGIELQQSMEQELLAFTSEQKEYLEYHLKRYLSQYLLD